MNYEIKNLKENRTKVLFLGSDPQFITESIEFDIVVKTNRATAEGHLKVEPMLPSDFQEYVERIVNKIAKSIEEKSAIKLDNIDMSLSYEG